MSEVRMVWPALVDSNTGRVTRPELVCFAPGTVFPANATGNGTTKVEIPTICYIPLRQPCS